jgi:hypothetical protein
MNFGLKRPDDNKNIKINYLTPGLRDQENPPPTISALPRPSSERVFAWDLEAIT